MKKWLCLTALICIGPIATVIAQKPATCMLKGTVLDSSNAEPVIYASLSVFSYPKDSLVAGTLTNDKGAFEVEGLAPGSYTVTLAFIGFNTKRIGPIQLYAEEPQKALGRISLSPTNYQLSDVQITDRQDLMLNNIDRKTYNVDKTMVAEGGAVTDVLKTLPSVEVDIDGNVSLRGSGNVTVLIDGKPSALTGSSRSAVLAQIPASSIKSVEVITNPSARYDPDGMSGIINIITKKTKNPGLNGNLSVGAGTHQKYNSSLTLGYRNKKLNAYGTYSFRMEDRWGRGYSNSTTPADTASPVLLNSNHSNRQTMDHVARGGVDFYLAERTTLGIAGGWAGHTESSTDLGYFSETTEAGDTVSHYLRPNVGNEWSGTVDGEVNLQQKFKKAGRVLDARVAYSQGHNLEDNAFRTKYILENGIGSFQSDDYQDNVQDDAVALGTGQVDYEHKVNDNNVLMTGGKVTSRDIHNNFSSSSLNHSSDQFENDTLLSNDFRYRERIFAAYGIFIHSFNSRLAGQVGLRAEQALTRSVMVAQDSVFTNNYFKVFPNGYLSYKPKSGHEIRLSYGRRINRPTTDQLNPFTNYSNPKRLRVGNPSLLPETIDAFELSYNRRFDKGSLSATGYFRYISDSYTRFFTPVNPGSDTLLFTFVNLLNGQNYGVELIAQLRPAKWWDLMVSGNFFRTVMNASNLETDLTVNNLGMTSNLNSTFYFSKNSNLQLTANYSTPRIQAQGTFAATFFADVAFKQTFMKGKASLNLRMSDVFNTRRGKSFNNTETVSGVGYRKRESRIGYVTLSYRFGSGDAAPRKKKNQEERSGGEFDF